MSPTILLFFADASSPWTLQNILLTIFGLLGGTTVLATVSLLTLRGYWTKYVAPLILEEVTKWHADPAQAQARTKEHEAACQVFSVLPGQKELRHDEMAGVLKEQVSKDDLVAEIKKTIDNEIMRTDGLIHREIKTQVGEMETKLTAKLDTVLEFLRKDIEFKEQMLERMGALEGAVNASRSKPVGVPRAQTPPLGTPKIPR